MTGTLLAGPRRSTAGRRQQAADNRRPEICFRLSGANCRFLPAAGSTLGETVPTRDGGGVDAGSESRETSGGSRHGPAGGGGRGGRERRQGGDSAAGAA